MITSTFKNTFKLARNTIAYAVTTTDEFVTVLAANQEGSALADFTAMTFKESKELGREHGRKAGNWINTKAIDPTTEFFSETFDDLFSEEPVVAPKKAPRKPRKPRATK